MSIVSAKFSLLPTPARKKREPTEPEPIVRSAKLPRASEISVEQAPRQTQPTRRMPYNAPVRVCLYKYTDCAADLWDLFQGQEDIPLFQVQISHEAQRNLCVSMRDSFNDYLATSYAEHSTMPQTLQQLETAAGIKLVIANKADPEGVGCFVQWRVSFYCVDLASFLVLLDGWFQYKEKQLAREEPFQVALHPHLGIDVSVEDLGYEHYTIDKPAAALPLHIFEAQPVVGKRIITLNLQLDTDSVFDLIITGHTWPFRARMDAFGITGGYMEDHKETRCYYRVWKQIDVSQDAPKARFLEMLNEVFKNLALRVTLDREPNPNTHVAAFVEKLRCVRSLFFTPLTPAAR